MFLVTAVVFASETNEFMLNDIDISATYELELDADYSADEQSTHNNMAIAARCILVIEIVHEGPMGSGSTYERVDLGMVDAMGLVGAEGFLCASRARSYMCIYYSQC